jgi:hypothetical protein
MRNACDLDPAFGDVLALLRARETDGSSPLFSPGQRILDNARRFARSPDDCARFARAVRTTSVHPAILALEPGQPKAELFAGDALYAAGFAAPLEGAAYAPAARWPASALFQPVGPAWAHPGDLLIIGSHIEVITRVSPDGGPLTTLGARPGGLAEDQEYGRKALRARREVDRFVLARTPVQVLRVTSQGRQVWAE